MKPVSPLPALPEWARNLVELYESNAASQFLVYGNVNDRMLIPCPGLAVPDRLGSLNEFLLDTLLPGFDVVLSFDLGNGIRVEKGGPIFSQWPYLKDGTELASAPLPKAPRGAIELLTRYFRYAANLGRLSQTQQTRPQIACLIRNADLLIPPLPGGHDYDLAALVTLIRDWASDSLLTGHALATFLIAENLNDIHPLVVNNPRAAHIEIPLPGPDEFERAGAVLAPQYPASAARQFTGATLAAVESLFKSRQHAGRELKPSDMALIKKKLVERDANGLVELIETTRTLDHLYGLEKVKAWLRQDLALWNAGDLAALPKGYLICGPVGTGKTFLMECLAGEAGVPVVRLKNFRDRWVGSTEGNLERIFRLLKALGRCYVFVDEADQALGRREAGANDSGISGRVYSMIAEEMGNSGSRGRVIWVLASSRPDLIEVDLKRPGRVDVRIPLFPTLTPREGFDLIRMLARARGIALPDEMPLALEAAIPDLLTPGAAEALATKLYRLTRTTGRAAADVLEECLTGYRPPVAREVLEAQMRLAMEEATDPGFVPAALLKYRGSELRLR